MNSTKPVLTVFPFFVLRNPSLTVNSLYEEKMDNEFIRGVFSDNEIQKSILVASKSVHQDLLKWLKGEMTSQKKEEKLIQTLLKYFVRMSMRCTPFGLFSSISYGQWDKLGKYRITIPSSNDMKIIARMDMAVTCSLMEKIAKVKELQDSLLFKVNPTIYQVADKYRYVEYNVKGRNRFYSIVSVDFSEPLEHVLEFAGGGKTLSEIERNLVDHGVPVDQALSFIEKLSKNQLLSHELEPNVTGDAYFDRIIKVCRESGSKAPDVNSIFLIKNTIDKINAGKCTIADGLEDIIDELKSMRVNYNPSQILQIDSKRSIEKQELNEDFATSVLEATKFLISLKTNHVKPFFLSRFIERFKERYENREVPLLEAIDSDLGIGYNNPFGSGEVNDLIDDLGIVKKMKVDEKIELDQIDQLLLKKYIACLQEGKNEIVLSDADKLNDDIPYHLVPDSLTSAIQVLSSNPDTRKSLILIRTLGNPSALNLIGRFCYLDDQLDAAAKSVAKFEQSVHEPKIIAEVAHLPGTRSGNVVARPRLRDYEIPYGTKSDAKGEFEIGLNELYISVVNNRLILKSKSLNREIIPRHSSAHTFSNNSLPIYQFLGELQLQQVPGNFTFSWGRIKNLVTFLPRVRYRNCIFSLAKWRIESDSLKVLAKNQDDTLILEMRKLRSQYTIPSKVTYKNRDHQLFLDLENPKFISLLYTISLKETIIELEEWLFDEDEMFCEGAEGAYINELIVPIKKHLTSND